MAKAQTEMAKIQVDLEKSQNKSMLDLQKMEQQERIESARLASKMATQQGKDESQKEIEGFKAGFNTIRDLIDD